MKITKWMAAAALLLSFGLSGCTEDLTDEVSQLTRNTDEVSVAYNKGATASFTVRVPGAWAATAACKDAAGQSTSSWITLDPAEGVGDGKEYQTVTVIADRNAGEAREAIITVVGATRGDAVEIKVSQEAGIFEVGDPVISGSLKEKVPSTASIEISYTKALGGEEVTVEASFEGDNYGLSVEKYSTTVEAEGDGAWKVPIEGTPTKMGLVTINLKITAGELTFDRKFSYDISSETTIFRFGFDKFVWGGDAINNEEGVVPTEDGTGATGSYDGTEPARSTCTRGTDGTGNCFATMGEEYRKNRDISDWDGTRVYEHPGYVKIGVAAEGGWIMTPPMSAIAGTTDIDVSFKAAHWNEENGHTDIVFAVEGDGVIDGSAVLVMPASDTWKKVKKNGWTQFKIRVLDATSNTRLKWSAADLTTGGSRFMLDDILVETSKVRTEPLNPVNAETVSYTAEENSLTFTWDAVEDASAYRLELAREATPDFMQTVEVAETTYTFDKLEPDYYLLTIRALFSQNEEFDSAPTTVTAATKGLTYGQLAAPTLNVTATSWTAKATWDPIERATGYECVLKDGGVAINTQTLTSEQTSINYTGLTEEHQYELSVTTLYEFDPQYNSVPATATIQTVPLTIEAPTNVALYAKSPTTLTFAWDDTNKNGRTYTVQYASEASDKAAKLAEFSYTWTTKSTDPSWTWAYPTRITIVSFMNEDRTIGSEANLIRPGQTYYFRVRCGGASDESKWSDWVSATTDTRTAPANEIFYEGFDRCFVGGGDWLNQANCSVITKDKNQTDIWQLKLSTSLAKDAVTTFGNIYTAGNMTTDVASWIGYTRIWDRGTGNGDLQPCPGYVKCGNSSNVGAFRILALGTDKLAAEGEDVTLTFKATPWSEVTTGAGYTMDNKLVDIYVNDVVVATDVRITDSNAVDGDPAVLTDMKWKTVSIDIPALKPTDQITIMSKTNEAAAGKGRFFLDEVSVVKK